MSKLIEKSTELARSIEEHGEIEIGMDLETGSLVVNGIAFTLAEQLELVNEREKDPSMTDLVDKVAKASVNYKPAASKDPKDAEIERLKAEIASLKVTKGLHFPEDFQFAQIPFGVSDVSDEDVQNIITELEATPVEEGKFILHRTKDVAVLKISDCEGTGYLVTAGYYFANISK